MAQKEVWKDVKNYEGIYQVSNLGRVKSLSRYVIRVQKNIEKKQLLQEKMLKLGRDSSGYLSCSLSNNIIKNKTYRIHQLVAIAFLNHTPCGHKLVVDHIDNNKTNNNLSNIQIITKRENSSKDKKNGSSKYVGVCWNKSSKKWESRIQINGKIKYLGAFNSELESSIAYKKTLSEL